MRISDWSSDVCSSDLATVPPNHRDACPKGRVRKDGYRCLDLNRNGVAASLQGNQLSLISLPSMAMPSRIFSSETVTKLRRRVLVCGSAPAKNGAPGTNATLFRSEEHTSELQSLMRISYAVFVLNNKNPKNS